MGSSPLEARRHEPVLQEEVLRLLDPRPGKRIVDLTVGSGGHAGGILKRLGPQGWLIGIDQDREAIERARINLASFPHVELIHSNFVYLDEILAGLNLETVDAVLLDVGASREQLEDARRGFSFLKEGPLDMRMDPEGRRTARDLVNDLSQRELETIFRRYGEERWAKRIAAAICQERQGKPIETTGELARIVAGAVPGRFRFGRRHPATRVFQALRIQVNQELEALETVLPKAFEALGRGGRLAAITFHSLEDRIVKQTFREWEKEERGKILTPKPVQPTWEEIRENPRARSAKLRGMRKG